MSDKILHLIETVKINIINTSIPSHQHEDIEIIFVLSGEMSVVINHTEQFLSEGDFIFINSNDLHSCKYISTKFSAAVFTFNHLRLNKLLEKENALLSADLPNSLNYEMQLKSVLRSLLISYYKENDSINLHYYSNLINLLSILKSGYCTEHKLSSSSKNIDSTNGDRKTKILHFLERHYKEEITLKDCADFMGLSLSYASKQIRTLIGGNFITELNRIRLTHAKHEIEQTDQTISHIASANGFSSIQSFDRLFRKKYGSSPLRYRKKYQSEKKNGFNSPVDKHKKLFSSISDNQNSVKELNISAMMVADNKHTILTNCTKIINILKASDLLNYKVQEQLIEARKHIPFLYVRIENFITDPAMFISINEDQSEYNFSMINMVLSFLVENGMKPFICFPLNPYRNNSNIKDTRIENLYPYYLFLSRFRDNMGNQFGRDEIGSWYFEVTDDYIDHDLERYCEFFTTFYYAAKLYNDKSKIGGPGYLYGKETLEIFGQTLHNWKKRYIIPDFVSVQLYENDQSATAGVKRTKSNDFHIDNVIDDLRNILKVNEMIQTELIITKWNEFIAPQTILHDSCNRASYIVKTMTSIVSSNAIFIYSDTLDISYESHATKKILNGTPGLINKQGIKKPAFFALAFFSHLGTSYLHCGLNHIITVDSDGSYHILIHNYKQYKK